MKCAFTIFPVMALLGCMSAHAGESTSPQDRSTQQTTRAQLLELSQKPDVMVDLNRLMRLQDDSAAGRPGSIAEQKRLLAEIGDKLRVFFDSAPAAQLIAVAPDVAAYVLSGGDPAVAALLSRKDTVGIRMRGILEASGAFMQGDRETAAGLLRDVDTQRLPLRLAGRIALVQALLAKDDGPAKQAHLAVAIAAMPGSLIEESALRRSALAYAATADERRFWERIARYQRRFPNSLYSAAFWREVSDAIIDWVAKDGSFRLNRLDLEWNGMSLVQRRKLYLALTRQAAAANNPRVVEFAATRLHRLAVEGGQEDQISRLYMAIYKIASPEGDSALRGLKSIRSDLLGEQDKELLNAALALSEQINRPLPAVSSSTVDEEEPLLRRGRQALTDSDALLEGLPF